MGASWYLVNNHCVLSTSEGGVGGSEDIWRWHCHQIVNAQQEFHWFNNMHWASTIHTGTMQDYESKTLNTTHTGVWAGWHLQFYYSASQLQAALSATNGRSRQRKREEEKFCSPTNRALLSRGREVLRREQSRQTIRKSPSQATSFLEIQTSKYCNWVSTSLPVCIFYFYY